MIHNTEGAASTRGRRPRPAHGGLVLGAFLCAACAACGPRDPLDMKVDARDYIGLSMWQSDAGRRLSARQLADFGEAMQEIKFHVMAEGMARGSADVDTASWGIIDERTVRDVLQMGLGWELYRSREERSELVLAMRRNARLTTRPGDAESATYLSELRGRQVARLNAANAQISHVLERLAASGLAAQAAEPPGAGVDDPLEPAAEDQAPVAQPQRTGGR